MATYDKGDLVRLTGTFTDPENSDAAIDPTTVSVTIKTPGAVSTTYVYGTDAEVEKSSTGVYKISVNANEVGQWCYRWFSTGTGQASEPGCFWVKDNPC